MESAILDWFTPERISALVQVVIIDLTLAGDNAIVIGLAAAGLPARQRGKAIMIGILAATAIRIVFALLATQLLQVVGLLLAGGVLLLWVSWKMWRELKRPSHVAVGAAALAEPDAPVVPGRRRADEKSLRTAIIQIIVADISMSLDNVLAVAGAAREHPAVLIFGLAFSVVLMGVAATLIANILQKHRWIAYIGLAIILYVAAEMIFKGSRDLMATPGVVEGVQGLLGARS